MRLSGWDMNSSWRAARSSRQPWEGRTGAPRWRRSRTWRRPAGVFCQGAAWREVPRTSLSTEWRRPRGHHDWQGAGCCVHGGSPDIVWGAPPVRGWQELWWRSILRWSVWPVWPVSSPSCHLLTPVGSSPLVWTDMCSWKLEYHFIIAATGHHTSHNPTLCCNLTQHKIDIIDDTKFYFEIYFVKQFRKLCYLRCSIFLLHCNSGCLFSGGTNNFWWSWTNSQ